MQLLLPLLVCGWLPDAVLTRTAVQDCFRTPLCWDLPGILRRCLQEHGAAAAGTCMCRTPEQFRRRSKMLLLSLLDQDDACISSSQKPDPSPTAAAELKTW